MARVNAIQIPALNSWSGNLTLWLEAGHVRRMGEGKDKI